MTRITKSLALLVFGLFSLNKVRAQQSPRIEIDLTHSGPSKEKDSVFRSEETRDGYLFRTPNGINYEVHIAHIRPQLALKVTHRKDGKYRYEFTIENEASAKDAIRTVTLSFDKGLAGADREPVYEDRSEPAGWNGALNMFRGEIKPGHRAKFGVTSDLAPEQTLLLVSGINHEERVRERERLLESGVNAQLFRYAGKVLGTREYAIYRLHEHARVVGQ